MVRLAEVRDEAAVRACAEAAYERYVPLIGRAPAPMVADFEALITAESVYVADAGGVLGFIVYFRQDDVMLLENVAVLPEQSGRGIGRDLIARCEDAARQAGLRAVRLYTNVVMVENLAIYPRLGYREVDRRREDGFDRVYFEKPLAGCAGAGEP